jgi:hypothetical protein
VAVRVQRGRRVRMPKGTLDRYRVTSGGDQP